MCFCKKKKNIQIGWKIKKVQSLKIGTFWPLLVEFISETLTDTYKKSDDLLQEAPWQSNSKKKTQQNWMKNEEILHTFQNFFLK
jgi:hypothetical protein